MDSPQIGQASVFCEVSSDVTELDVSTLASDTGESSRAGETDLDPTVFAAVTAVVSVVFKLGLAERDDLDRLLSEGTLKCAGVGAAGRESLGFDLPKTLAGLGAFACSSVDAMARVQ